MDEVGCVGGCGRVRWRRGLCPACYRRRERQIKAGETTWKQLERRKRCLPRQKSWGCWQRKGAGDDD